jgi:hypothetical protein
MANISVSLPADGETIDAADYNTPINTIVNEINGNLDNSNIDAAAAIAGSKLADSAITTAKIADANVTNAKLATGAGEPGGAWTSWTPSFTNLSGGTLNYAKYTQVGKTILYRIKYTLGGAGVSGSISFSLPVNLTADYVANDSLVGDVTYLDTGNARYTGVVAAGSTASTLSIRAINASGTYSAVADLSATVPFTWGNTDVILVAGSYEGA